MFKVSSSRNNSQDPWWSQAEQYLLYTFILFELFILSTRESERLNSDCDPS